MNGFAEKSAIIEIQESKQQLYPLLPTAFGKACAISGMSPQDAVMVLIFVYLLPIDLSNLIFRLLSHCQKQESKSF
jgi:hypothetical protein